jgi:hypothetical protein
MLNNNAPLESIAATLNISKSQVCRYAQHIFHKRYVLKDGAIEYIEHSLRIRAWYDADVSEFLEEQILTDEKRSRNNTNND